MKKYIPEHKVQRMRNLATKKFGNKTKIQIGYGNSESEHVEGDIWEEKIGNTIYTIEQKNGFRVKRPKNSVAAEVREYLNSYPNCRQECCKTSFNHLDKKMQRIHGMCYDCVIDMEHQLRKDGKYEEYEQKKIYENAKAWIVKAEDDVEQLKKYIQKHNNM